MGTSLLAMPWAMEQAGFALGSFLILAVGALSLYTAYRVVQSPSGLSKFLSYHYIFLIVCNFNSMRRVNRGSSTCRFWFCSFFLYSALGVDSAAADLPDVCRYFWGTYGTFLATTFSIIVLLGSCVVYWVIMSNFLFYTGNVIHGNCNFFAIFILYIYFFCLIFPRSEKFFCRSFTTEQYYCSYYDEQDLQM